MNHTSPGQNTVTESLNDLLDSAGGSSARPYATLIGHNMGNNSLLLSLPIHNFYEISEVANETNIRDKEFHHGEEVAQRKLDPKHAQRLAVYILKGLFGSLKGHYKSQRKSHPVLLDTMIDRLGKQPYLSLQPITANIRRCLPQGDGLQVERAANGKMIVYLSDLHVLWVVDGQHRRHAIDMVFDFLKHLQLHRSFPKKGNLFPNVQDTIESEELAIWGEIFEMARSKCTVMVEVHLGLTAEQERQLFHDLNNLTKKVESSLAFNFDSSNPINSFIKETLKDEGIIKATISETDKVDWHNDQGEISWKDMISINARLFLNKANITGALPADIAERKDIAIKFWETVNEVPDFGVVDSRKKTVIAQPVVLKALAKMVYDFNWGKSANPRLFNKLIDGIQEIDFAHSNPMWRFYSYDANTRDQLLPGLSAYLPKSEGANRDIGAWDQAEQVIRFGAKHNDIFPILGDMIRWKLNLPNRHNILENFDL